MSVLIMLVFGAGVGAGIVLLSRAVRPAGRPMHEVFESVEQPGEPFSAESTSQAHSLHGALVAIGSALSIGAGHDVGLQRDLAITGSSLEQHAVVKAVAPALTLVGSSVLWSMLGLVGADVNSVWATLMTLVAAVVGFGLPDIRLRRRAKAARVAFRHALSAYLDLVTIIMSGGGGLLTALQTAADSGDGWAFAEIRAALDRARLSNRTPWSQLGLLGDRFDIGELRDLVAAAELAGSEGARISESVATKSDVLRARLQSEVERNAESLTEQMLVPVGLLLVALFLFLGFALFEQFGESSPPDWLETASVAPPRLVARG